MDAAILLLAWGYALWIMFLAVMALKHAWATLPIAVRILAVPAVMVAMVLDVGFNVAATIPFFDLPAEWTFSQRMGRYKRQGTGWRAATARWVCANLLDPFEIGGHCRD